MAVSVLAPDDIRFIINELNAGTSFADIKTALSHVDGTFLDTQETALTILAVSERSLKMSGPDYQAAQWRAGAVPAVVSVLPTSGSTSGLNTVYLTGSNFVEGLEVAIGTTGLGVTTLPILSMSETAIAVQMPPHAAMASIDFVVTNPNDETDTLTDAYTYVAP